MGYLNALGMAEAADLDTALGWHLSANHYPPIPSEMIPVAKEAIDAMLELEPERPIDLRDIVEYRDSKTAPAWALVEHMHLDAFIDSAMDEEE